MNTPYSAVIIGAGILGLATARELLQRFPGARLAIIDKEDAPGRHQSGHNSGVLHAGVYYKPGSLKAQLCVQGKAAMERFADEHGIRYETCGKLIVALDSIRAGSARRPGSARPRQRCARSADGRAGRRCARSSRTPPVSAPCTRRAPASSTSVGGGGAGSSCCVTPAWTSTSVTRSPGCRGRHARPPSCRPRAARSRAVGSSAAPVCTPTGWRGWTPSPTSRSSRSAATTTR